MPAGMAFALLARTCLPGAFHAACACGLRENGPLENLAFEWLQRQRAREKLPLTQGSPRKAARPAKIANHHAFSNENSRCSPAYAAMPMATPAAVSDSALRLRQWKG
jgi:hypothetical protein